MRLSLHRGAAAALVAVLGLLMPGVAAAHSAAGPFGSYQELAQPRAEPPQPTVLARLELSDLSPRVVTIASAPVLRVTGRVVDVGDRPITKLAVRLQRDEPMRSDEAAAQALQGLPEATHVTRFQPLPGDLTPGQSRPFQLEVPLRGAEATSLQVNGPGVYPVLVTLNGKPEAGGAAQLASVPLLLPVLGIPPATSGGPPGPVLRRPPQPAPLTVLWPLAGAPERLPTGPGEPMLVFSDRAGTDPLAADIAPGGRLDGLLGALQQAIPPGSPLGAAVCVAVDPLLLETLDGMSHGYRVAYPGGIGEGTGARNARSWLDRLRGAVQGRCVLPLPYADADLVALSRAGLTDLEALATSTGARLVSELLGVQPLTGVSWPAGEMLDERTLADLTALQTHAVLLDPHGIIPQPAPRPIAAPPTENVADDVVGLVGSSSGSTNPGTAIPGGRGAAPVGLLVDPLLTSALASSASPLSAQNGLGALVYRAASGRPVLLVPPRRWQAPGTEVTALLNTAQQLLQAGFVTPRELPALATTPPTGVTVAVRCPPQASGEEIPPQVTADVQRDRDVLRDLQVATVLDPAANIRPATLLDPLRLGLLRGVSTAWRGKPNRAALVTAEVTSRLNELRRSVRIVQPPGPYTLAASDSPLLITVSNELPVGMHVALSLSETAGLRAGGVGLQLVPAHSTRQLVIPAKVNRAGQFSVDVRLSTPGGTPLGEPSTLQLRSTAFGKVTVALTAGAGAALILLVSRGMVRRVRRTRQARDRSTGPLEP
ncbi:MAG: hypothetical protein JO309_11030 [Pseudonocardiales bacterium]|nr:hypothetical protein [Pseudonocardiales bacterium]